MRTFLNSERAPWGVLDTWLNRGDPLEVFTVLADHARGQGWLAQVKGAHHGTWGLAVVNRVSEDPADRLREALDQSKARHGASLDGSASSAQVSPARYAAPRRAGVTADEVDIGAPRNFRQDHQFEMSPAPLYAQDRHGQGRWVCLYRFGKPVATLWTDDAQGLGLIPEPGVSVALLLNAIGSAYAQGTPAAWAFDDLLAWTSPDHGAGPVHRGDLLTLRSDDQASQRHRDTSTPATVQLSD